MECLKLFRCLHDDPIADHREAFRFQIIKQSRLGIGRHLAHFAVAVGIKVQIAFRRQGRVQLAETAGCCITRVGKKLRSDRFLLFIKLAEHFLVHDHLATDFKNLREAIDL